MDYLSHVDMFTATTKLHSEASAKPDKLSYAMAVANTETDPPEDSTTTNKGGFIAIKINQQLYEQQLLACQHALIARLVLSKGEEPWKLAELKKRLSTTWGLTNNWKLIALGRGFFHIILNSSAEKNRIWSRGAVTLKPGIIRLHRWTPNFDPLSQKSTHAQLWVRLYKLPWEYWHQQILASIARGIGVPLKFDNNTLHGEYGHYARILIDLDLSSPLPETLLIERVWMSFFIDVTYENLPSFCNSCSNIGHLSKDCRMGKKIVVIPRKPEKAADLPRKSVQKLKVTPVNNSFSALNALHVSPARDKDSVPISPSRVASEIHHRPATDLEDGHPIDDSEPDVHGQVVATMDSVHHHLSEEGDPQSLVDDRQKHMQIVVRTNCQEADNVDHAELVVQQFLNPRNVESTNADKMAPAFSVEHQEHESAELVDSHHGQHLSKPRHFSRGSKAAQHTQHGQQPIATDTTVDLASLQQPNETDSNSGPTQHEINLWTDQVEHED